MKRADRINAGFVLMAGDQELKDRSVVVRNMKTKEQLSIPIDKVVDEIQQLITKKLRSQKPEARSQNKFTRVLDRIPLEGCVSIAVLSLLSTLEKQSHYIKVDMHFYYSGF